MPWPCKSLTKALAQGPFLRFPHDPQQVGGAALRPRDAQLHGVIVAPRVVLRREALHVLPHGRPAVVVSEQDAARAEQVEVEGELLAETLKRYHSGLETYRYI